MGGGINEAVFLLLAGALFATGTAILAYAWNPAILGGLAKVPGCLIALIVLFVALTVVLALLFGGWQPFGADDAEPPPAAEPTMDVTPLIEPPLAPGAPPTDEPTSSVGPVLSEPPATPVPTVPVAHLVPLEGEWQISNLRGLVDCGRVQIPLADMQAERGTIRLLDGGESLLADGFAEGTVDIVLERRQATPASATYVGAVDIAALGEMPPGDLGDFSLVYTMVFDSPAHMAGEMSGQIDAGGISCAVSRPAEGALVEASDPAAALVRSQAVDDPPVPVNCDPDDATPTRIVAVDEPLIAPAPMAALEAFLAGPAEQPPITSGFVEFREPNGTVSYGAYVDDTLNLVIRVRPLSGGSAVTEWEASSC